MPRIKRTYKTLTLQEGREYDRLLAKIEKDRPELEAWARAGFERDRRLREVFRALKEAREAQGLSLTLVSKRTGIAKGNLSKLENDPHANPTLQTLMRYAESIGVDLRVSVKAAAKRKVS